MISRVLIAAALIVTALANAACTNTVRGMGADVNNNGQAAKKAIKGR